MGKVSVIGDGGWGTTLAILLCKKGIDTVLWSAFPDYAEHLRRTRENTKFLKGITLPKELKITSEEAETSDSEYIVSAAPSKYLRPVLQRFQKVGFKNIISATKGIENGTLKRSSEIIEEYFPKAKISVLSGPSISFEVAEGVPTTVVAASVGDWKSDVQELFTTDKFRVYTSSDVIGVELGGALKNVIAIAAGISDGLGFGTNTKAAILTRGLAEISRLGAKMGAQKETFSGLSGLGDLATTCISSQSRNRWFGEQIGKGRSIDSVLGETEMVVEGLATAKSGNDLAKKYSVEMPITKKIYEIVYEGKDPALAVKELMTRDPKEEDYG